MISRELFFAFVLFAAVMFFTPGPNNIMVMASGLLFGFRRTVPHILGVVIGFAFMVGAVGLGFGTVFIAFPVLQTILKYAGAAYLIYLAVAIARSHPTSSTVGMTKPLTFWQGAIFQWVNVKGWVAIIGTITAYAAIASFPLNIVLQVLIFLAMGTASITIWTLFGSALRPVLTSARAVRVFNLAMAALLLASLYPVFME